MIVELWLGFGNLSDARFWKSRSTRKEPNGAFVTFSPPYQLVVRGVRSLDIHPMNKSKEQVAPSIVSKQSFEAHQVCCISGFKK